MPQSRQSGRQTKGIESQGMILKTYESTIADMFLNTDSDPSVWLLIQIDIKIWQHWYFDILWTFYHYFE